MQKVNTYMPICIIGPIVVAVFFTFFYMGLWYIFQPILTYIAIAINDMLTAQGLSSSNSDTIILLAKLVIDICLLFPIAGLWIWVINKAQERDYRGYPQYG